LIGDGELNADALIAVVLFAGALLSIFGAIYWGAAKSHAKGEMDFNGLKMLRWALAGYVCLYVLLAITAFVS
jgi:uncharacterized membrane protein